MKKNTATTDLSTPYRTAGFVIKAPKGVDKEHSIKSSLITSGEDLRTKGGKKK